MGARFHRHHHRQAACRKSRPQADVVWGLAASSLAILDQRGMLQNAPADLSKIGANYRDAANPPAWVGMDVWAGASASTPSKPKSRA